MRIPHDDVVALMDEASDRLVMPRFGALQAGDIDEKRANDFVTIADREAERFLAPRLEGLLPGSLALGEEAAAVDPALLGRLDSDTPLWIIDPVDGTRSFIDGKPDFGLIVALSRGDEVLAGWILQPTLGRRAAAEHGAGLMRGGPSLTDGSAPRPADALPRAIILGRLPDGGRARDRAPGRFDLRPRPGGGAIACGVAGGQDHPCGAQSEPCDLRSGEEAVIVFVCLGGFGQRQGALARRAWGGDSMRHECDHVDCCQVERLEGALRGHGALQQLCCSQWLQRCEFSRRLWQGLKAQSGRRERCADADDVPGAGAGGARGTRTGMAMR
jgi:hypothetical protein